MQFPTGKQRTPNPRHPKPPKITPKTTRNMKYGYVYKGVPSQPSNFRATDIGETAVTLQWTKPTHSSENIVHYELYWNDTYANQAHHK